MEGDTKAPRGVTMISMENEIKTFTEWVRESNNIVFFGGAGVSTESGIPDFRSVDGLYSQKYDYPPEEILSHTFFMNNPEEFYRFYRDKILLSGIMPNTTHKKLAELERCGKLKAVITQNIDGLHQDAGSEEVLEVHGTVARNHCMRCGAFYDAGYVRDMIDEGRKKDAKGITRVTKLPYCEKCGGLIKPDVVLYEEGLDDSVWSRSVQHISEADMLIVGGTSLVVYPAAGLVNYYHGHRLVLINKSVTPYDSYADLVIHESLGEVFSQIDLH